MLYVIDDLNTTGEYTELESDSYSQKVNMSLDFYSGTHGTSKLQEGLENSKMNLLFGL